MVAHENSATISQADVGSFGIGPRSRSSSRRGRDVWRLVPRPWIWPELGARFVENLDVEAELMLARTAKGECYLAHSPAFHLIGVPKTWLGVRPQGQDSASPRLPVHVGGLVGGLSLTSRVGLVLMYTARVKHPVVESAVEDL
jgi:hypothetical protein